MAQQNLDFNIVAHTKGMEAIATLINRVGSLEAETKRLASANQTLSASTETVIRNGVRYNNAMDAQSRQLRQNRQGTQQLGMQINDFATSVSSGSSVTQAFTQQLGQVGFAMSQMGGVAGRIGSFLAGPWGAAVLIGAMALGPIIDKLFQSEEAAKKAADAHYKYLDAVAAGNMADLIKAEGELTKMQEKRLKLMDKINAQRPGRIQPTGGFGVGFGGAVDPTGDAKAQLERINQEIAFQQIAIDAGNRARQKLDQATKRTTGPSASSKPSGGASDAVKAAEKAAKRQAEIAQYITDVNIKADKEWRDYWVKSEQDQMVGLQEKLKFMGEMADATVQTTTERLIKPVMDQAQEIQNAFANVAMSVNNAFKGMVTGAMSWKDGIKGIISSVIDELWRLYVVQQIVGFVTKAIGGITGNPGPSIDSAITVTRGRAVGGYVAAQTPYVVGEKGPELFVPGGSGTIIPNKNMGSVGGTSGMTINVDARGSSDPAAVRAQVQQGILEAAPAIIAAAQNKTVQGLRRPRLGGVMQ